MPRFLRLSPLALAIAAGHAWAQHAVPPKPGRAEPVVVEANEIRGRPDLETVLEGDALLQRGPLTLRADHIGYDNVEDLARARGNVRITRGGDRFSGPELQLRLQRFEGWFLQPEYFFERTGAGGNAARIDFIDQQRSNLTEATYTSCPRDGSGDPAWLLSTRQVRLDFEANEGRAEGAVLRFYGVPILAAPSFSFPLTDDRKSGWLPPSFNLDNKSGLEFGVPWYWNIAPNRDATFVPTVMSRRGLWLGSEFRYLEPHFRGELNLDLLPGDRAAGRDRFGLRVAHEGDAPQGAYYRADVVRVSDDNFWKDFPRAVPVITPRLLPTDLLADRPWSLPGGSLRAYARLQQWQVLQDDDPAARIVSPYERSPQLGIAGRGDAPVLGGLKYGFETEFNRFTRPGDEASTLLEGSRWHAIGSLSRRFEAPGWWVAPRLSVNVASYRTDEPMSDGRRSATRAIPTFSIDSGMLFERDVRWFKRDLRQTLEPRVLYVNTPYRDQLSLPNFDAAGKDFNIVSVFSDNAFSGVDRVSDAHQVTAGVTSRVIDSSGVEAARVGVVQRYLLRDQRVTPEGEPFTQRFSDLLLLGSGQLGDRVNFDAAMQYSPDTRRVARSVITARYSPGPFRTVSTSYRLARGSSEQVDVGWQWPVYRAEGASATGAGNSGCRGTLYSVGRMNYSLRDSRITDSIVGLEYDAGCWIGRVVAERLSTGRTEATTRLLLQIEFVGLSRLGSNPLQVLKDNIPGYRLLRDRRGEVPPPPVYE